MQAFFLPTMFLLFLLYTGIKDVWNDNIVIASDVLFDDLFFDILFNKAEKQKQHNYFRLNYYLISRKTKNCI